MKKCPVPKKKYVQPSGDESAVRADDSPAPARRTKPPRRAARPQPKKYAGIGSDDEVQRSTSVLVVVSSKMALAGYALGSAQGGEDGCIDGLQLFFAVGDVEFRTAAGS